MINFSKSTAGMIYLGTLLLSVLSFFTTFMGMKILLDPNLAFIGALGLQIALLGIAWNLMRFKNNRTYYLIVFMASASFSILFSYANFDSSLKSKTRLEGCRRIPCAWSEVCVCSRTWGANARCADRLCSGTTEGSDFSE